MVVTRSVCDGMCLFNLSVSCRVFYWNMILSIHTYKQYTEVEGTYVDDGFLLSTCRRHAFAAYFLI